MPVRVVSLASGSSGNATLVQSDRATILIDAGIGPRLLGGALKQYGTTLAGLDAVALTHEHSDHVRAIPSLIKAGVPLVTTAGTAAALGAESARQSPIRAGGTVEVGDLTLTALAVSHDAREPVAFAIEHRDARILLLTDLGRLDDGYLDWIARSDLVILESNHDADLLRWGPYPPHLKRRVASPLGHLSNETAGRALADAMRRRTGVPTIWLGHLSETNNRPALAVESAVAALAAVGRVAPVSALQRGKASPAWSSDPARRPAVQAPLLLE